MQLVCSCGVKVRLYKCGVYSRDSTVTTEAINFLGIPRCDDRLSVACAPVGKDACIALHANAKAQDVAKFIGLQYT